MFANAYVSGNGQTIFHELHNDCIYFFAHATHLFPIHHFINHSSKSYIFYPANKKMPVKLAPSKIL